MEIWQKYYENGEYLRTAEAYGEQNYDMIDGRANNRPKEQKAAEPHHEARSADVSAKDVNAGEKASPGQEAQKLEKKQSAMPSGKRKRRSVLKRLRKNKQK